MSKSRTRNARRGGDTATMSWPELSHSFASALCEPALPVPGPVGKTDGAASLKRFNVYRNNVATGLTAAVAAGYPVIGALVGDEFFAAMAQVYVAGHLPSSPVLLGYGGDFPEFLETFEPALQLPYLPDVARVEWAFNESYHAADADPITIEALSALDPAALERVRLVLHPSLRLIRSDWPVLSIWHAHRQDDPAAHMAQLTEPSSECGFLVRPKLAVEATLLPAAAFGLLAALQDGKTLTEATAALPEQAQGELGAMLATLFAAGAVVGLATE